MTSYIVTSYRTATDMDYNITAGMGSDAIHGHG